MPTISSGILLHRRVVSGGAVSGGTVSGGTVSGGTVSGGAVSGGTVSGGAVSGGTVSGLAVSGDTATTEVFIARMGGPLWSSPGKRAWSVPKGIQDPGEESLAAARREFREEIGVDAPPLQYELLGDFRQKSGKIVRIFHADAGATAIEFSSSNLFDLEWPPRSGRFQQFPEIAEARWMALDEASGLLVAGQLQIIDALTSATH